MLVVAKINQPKLTVMIHDTEIPDYETWFTATFGRQKGEEMATSYESSLAQKELYLQKRMIDLSQRDGYFTVRQLVATELYDALQKQPDIFLASWSPPDSAGLPRRPTPFAYFFFIDGKFRWNSAVTSAEVPRASAQSKP